MKTNPRAPGRSGGFSLVELTVVVVILGVPRYRAALERGKAVEAYAYLDQVAKAQEMHLARTGRYADALADLGLALPQPEHFAVGAPSSADWQARWGLRLTRRGAASGFGAYSIAYDQDGFAVARSSIPAALSPTGSGGAQRISSSSGDGGASTQGGGNAGNGPNQDRGNSVQRNRGRG